MRTIYYLITHKNEGQIKRLTNRLLSGSDSFVLIHHDYSKYEPLAFDNLANVHVIDDYVPVKYGHISISKAMLRGIQWLEDENMDFDWLIMLSGQDYPVRPIHEIEATLGSTSFDAFVAHEQIYENRALHSRYFQNLCMQRYYYKRIKIPKLKAFFIKRRHPYREGLCCYAGSNWLNLSRRAVEFIWSRKTLIMQLIEYLEKASCPEETLFQTVLVNEPGLDIANDDKRYIVWQEDAEHPDVLCLDHLAEIRKSDAWFARKLDENTCPELLNKLDEILQGAI